MVPVTNKQAHFPTTSSTNSCGLVFSVFRSTQQRNLHLHGFTLFDGLVCPWIVWTLFKGYYFCMCLSTRCRLIVHWNHAEIA